RLEKRFGPMLVSMAGAFFLSTGYFIASISQGNFIILCLGVGIPCGIGTGCSYVCCLVVPTKNFPEHKGLATGISVAGFGAGAILLTTIVKSILATTPSISVLEIFRILALIYGLVIFSCSFLLYYAKQMESLTDQKIQVNFSDRRLWVLFATMFTGTFAGLLIIGNAKLIALSMNYLEETATLSITLLSLGNMSGRVFWGYMLDKIGIDKALALAYSILFVSTLALNFIAPSVILLNVSLVAIGIGFSSNFVLFAAKTTQLFGADKLGYIYPYIFLAYGIAGVIGPFVGGWLFDLNQNYTLAIFISGFMTLLGGGLYQSRVKMMRV
ncbi:MAG: MFS transporter, partial [Cytophagales bacterium]|nr:MFS transporter [Cytophagales bacterium]